MFSIIVQHWIVKHGIAKHWIVKHGNVKHEFGRRVSVPTRESRDV